jgi:hypothetical protein
MAQATAEGPCVVLSTYARNRSIGWPKLAEGIMKLGISDLSLTEVIGTTAVVLSLVFVGVQVRDGNREARAATTQSILSTDSADLRSAEGPPPSVGRTRC